MVPEERPGRRLRADDVTTLLLGVVVTLVGAYAWLAPVRITEHHVLALDDPRLGAEPFELTITLDPRSAEARIGGVTVPRARVGDTFAVPYGPDGGRRIEIAGVERTDGLVRIRTRCPTCETVEWGRRDATLDIRSVSGRVRPGMGYELHVRAGDGPLQIDVRSSDGTRWRHTLDPLDGVALEEAECPDEEAACSFRPGFTVGDDAPAVVRLRSREGSAGFSVRLTGTAYGHAAVRGTRSLLANLFFAGWFLVGALTGVASVARIPSARVRGAVLLAVGLSIPVALWAPSFSRWYWSASWPLPLAPVLAASAILVSGGGAYVLARGIGLPWSGPARLVTAGVVAMVCALVLAVPALLIDERLDRLLDLAPLGAGDQLAYASLYAATVAAVAGGWLLGAAARDRARMPVDGAMLRED